jgi:tetratricopeptide (TPR) repeat protein
MDALKNMLAQNPSDSFLRYGLAMEYKNAGDLEGAVREFRELIAISPDYSSAYFHGGQALERLGRLEEARELYVTVKTGAEGGARAFACQFWSDLAGGSACPTNAEAFPTRVFFEATGAPAR